MKYSNRLLVELLILFVLATFTAGVSYVSRVFVVSGTSMYPTLKNGERILVDKRAYVYVDPVKGDIVGLIDPNEPNLRYVKRVVAGTGDVIESSDNEIKVNAVPLYKTSGDPVYEKLVIPKNEYFVMGDNREVSYDSREFGTVPKSNIIGKAVAVIWPPGHIRFLK